jgi:ArsR family transcriptional regulator, lead/cadmium/zinc/bismuth-responsive transcriptional repressor
MGITKSEAFTKEQNEIAALAKSVAHPARVAILEHLLKTDVCITGDLVDVLPLAQATVSQHLRELKNAGLIKGNIQGTSVCYCLDKDKWKTFINTFDHLFERIKLVTKCC